MMSGISSFKNFMNSIKIGSVTEVEKKFKSKYLCIRDRENKVPIHVACESGNTDIVKFLVGKNGSIESMDIAGRRPLHYACQLGLYDLVEFLVNNDCDMNACDNSGRRPFHIAYEFGHFEIVKYLVGKGCDMEPFDIGTNQSDERLAKDVSYEEINNYLYIESRRKLIEEIERNSTSNKILNRNDQFYIKYILPTISEPDSLIGCGGFGKVYKTKYSEINFQFAIKEIEIRGSQEIEDKDATCIEQDINEYKRFLNHYSIVEHFGALKASNNLYLFLEYLPGGSLKGLIKKEKTMPEITVIKFAKQIAEGIVFLHDNKIIHRDIKPENMLLDKNGRIKLTDFGLSRCLENMSSRGSVYASTFCGTANYMAPEVIIGKKYTFSADIWSVGVTIVEMYSGHPPYHDLSQNAVIFKIGSSKKIKFKSISSISNEMKAVIKLILCPEPQCRPSAHVLINKLNFRMKD